MNGVLVIDKPSGPTSHDVVARARRLLGVRRVGHTGTLDPLATGVLPLVVGRATRLARFFSGGDKAYEATIRLGAATDTRDASGVLITNSNTGDAGNTAPAGITEGDLEQALEHFRGTYWQSPPPYSAKKIGGVRAYKLARAAKPPTDGRGGTRLTQPPPAQVTVRELHLESYGEGVARVRLVCSAGFYVRSLAHDLGARLGCGGYLESLRRTMSAGFRLADAAPLEALEADPAAAADAFVGMDHLLTHLPAAVLSPRGIVRAAHGNTVAGPDIVRLLPGLDGDPGGDGSPVRLLADDGALVAIARGGAGAVLHPIVVLI